MEVSKALLVAIFAWVVLILLSGCSSLNRPLGWKNSVTHGGSWAEVKQDLAGTFVHDWDKEWVRNNHPAPAAWRWQHSSPRDSRLFNAFYSNHRAIALGTRNVKPFNDFIEWEMHGDIKNNGIQSSAPGDYLFGRDPYTYPPRYYIMGGKLRLHPTPGQHKYNLYK